ncbi:TMAO reductase system protein TorT [Cupriavidus sp. UME77]|uniref:TMAO reductase system protein TorT n=1 Tax=Cupriavidus sp. UME77 TaxID=1862321 RepID=UPI0016042920|nr:TMAO reductase system protein TorT [Cupriavidus sp. UME77]MBB1632424.1 ATPase [Cupriavidus sp. UME77]
MKRISIPRLRAAAALAGALLACGPAMAQKALTIGYATPDLSSSFWISMTYGVEDEAKKLGVALVKLNAGGDANVNIQISQLQDLVQRKVDAVVVGATNGDAIRSAVEHAIGKGIPVVGLSSVPSSDKLASRISADHYDMGRLQAQCLGKALNGKGAVGMISQQQGQTWADLRRQGFLETIKAEYPGIKVVAESRSAVTRNGAINLVDDWLQRFPELDGIYSAVDDSAAGAALAVKSARREGVKISASNLSPTAQQMLQNGELACSSVQQIVTQGREALRQAVAAARKESTTAVVRTPSILATRDNLATLDLSLVTAPKDYRP